MIWLNFMACAVIIISAGTKLFKYGYAISAKISLSVALEVLILLATITSMLELVAGARSVVTIDTPQPNLTIGMVIGSNL